MVEIDQMEYIDCITAREDFIKLAIDLVKINKEQHKNSKIKAKQKPTIHHWKARGAALVTAYLLEKYPILIKVGMNPTLYSGTTTKIYSK